MKVKVHVQGQVIEVSVGDGKQTFQWLGSVVQERLKAFHVLRKCLETDSYIVTEIRNIDDELINPKDRLFEHAGPSGLTVSATVATTFPVDDWENPEMNDWMQSAYVKSSSGLHWAGEIEAWRHSLRQIKQANQGSKDIDYNATLLAQKVLPNNSRLIKIGLDFDESDLETLFRLDWDSVSLQHLQWMGEAERNQVGRVMQARYHLVCNVFAHYAGIGKVGQRYGLTVEELGHLLHFMRLANWKEEEAVIEELFWKSASPNMQTQHRRGISESSAAAAAQPKRPSENWPLMTRPHFAAFLVLFASQHVHAELKSDAATAQLLDEALASFWESITSKYLAYTCPDQALRQTILDHYQLMRSLYHHHSSVHSTFGPRLAAADFLHVMQQTGLVDAENESVCLACFLQAQLNPPVQLELDSVVLAEFFEAVSRVALRTIENINGLTDAKRIRMALHMLIELPLQDRRAHK